MKTTMLSLLLAFAASSTANAQEAPRGSLILGLKAGGVFPQAFSKLGTSYLFDLEIGATLPVVQRRLAITVDFGITQPQADGTTSDPRFDMSGGSYSWHLDQREIIGGLSLVYRHPLASWTPYVGIGPRMFILQSSVTGQAGMAGISESDETSVKLGVGIPIGLEIAAGPGRLLGELDFNVSSIDHRTTGDDDTGSLALAVGYRFLF